MLRLLFIILIFVSCHAIEESHGILSRENKEDSASIATEEFPRALSDIWYQGKAEISTFALKQNRYNAIHEGEVVQIFVSEDFLTDKQVKNDRYVNPNSVPILKNNSVRRFTTGLYDYSIFTSVFTNVKTRGDVATLKANMSSQDWCGQSYMQLNDDGKDYRMQLFSYFENEGDQDKNIAKALLLDEVFNLIRIDPSLLPKGTIKVLPSMLYARLKHSAFKSLKATASLSDYKGDLVNGEKLRVYQIEIEEYDATFKYIFEAEGTHEIMAWSEKYPSAFDGQLRETVAIRKAVAWLPYWQLNGVKDNALRAELKLGTLWN
jgi:hypothetical protein